MKRIKSACLLQTIHFQLKEDLDHTTAVQMVREELNHYKALLERNRTKYHRRGGAAGRIDHHPYQETVQQPQL